MKDWKAPTSAAGFGSRSGAIRAAVSTGAAFDSLAQMRVWLRLPEVAARTADPLWPTAESHGLWTAFVDGLGQGRTRTWRRQRASVKVRWRSHEPAPLTPVRLHGFDDATLVLSADLTVLGSLEKPIARKPVGLLTAGVSPGGGAIDVNYVGPDTLEFS